MNCGKVGGVVTKTTVKDILKKMKNMIYIRTKRSVELDSFHSLSLYRSLVLYLLITFRFRLAQIVKCICNRSLHTL